MRCLWLAVFGRFVLRLVGLCTNDRRWLRQDLVRLTRECRQVHALDDSRQPGGCREGNV
jgi:hypothetical protein